MPDSAQLSGTREHPCERACRRAREAFADAALELQCRGDHAMGDWNLSDGRRVWKEEESIGRD